MFFRDEGFAILGGQLVGLKYLDLSHCLQLTDAGFAHLAGLTQLVQLSLSWCDALTDVGLAHIAWLNLHFALTDYVGRIHVILLRPSSAFSLQCTRLLFPNIGLSPAVPGPRVTQSK